LHFRFPIGDFGFEITDDFIPTKSRDALYMSGWDFGFDIDIVELILDPLIFLTLSNVSILVSKKEASYETPFEIARG